MSMCIVQSKQPSDRLRSLERIIPPAVLWVIATDQTVSVACMHLPNGPKKGELSSPFLISWREQGSDDCRIKLN